MRHRASFFILAITNVAIVTSIAIATDQVPANVTLAQPPPRKIDQKEVEAGHAAAQADIGRKLIRYHIFGEPSMIDPELKRLAGTKYNISVSFHGCTPGPRIDYDRAYQEVVVAHLKTLYGFDPVSRLEKELREKQK